MQQLFDIKKLCLSLWLMCCISLPSYAQFLQKNISLTLTSTTVGKALHELEDKGGFKFSYQSKLVPANKSIVLSPASHTVSDWLQRLFGNKLQWKETATHVVLYNSGESSQYFVSGYIKDVKTGAAISNAVVFDTEMLASTLSDDNGYYRLALKNNAKKSQAHLRYSRNDYVEHNITVTPGYDQQQEVLLLPNMEVTLDSVEIYAANRLERSSLGKMLVGTRQMLYAVNVKDFLSQQPVQFSVIPGLGTQGPMSAAARNNFSFNLMGGYTGSLNGFEIGTVFNIVKGDAHYVQIAGAFNYVDKNFKGIQISSAYNRAENIKGVQIVGGMNVVNASADGTMISGGVNYVQHNFNGLQIAGFSNANLNKGITRGVQLAGFSNWSNSYFKGLQLSGCVNIAQEGKGVQLGVINRAKSWKGVQFGLINYTDSLDGAAIGLININSKGLKRVLLATNEVSTIQLSWQSGNRYLYTILQAGFKFITDNNSVAVGAGFGTEFSLSKKMAVQTDATYSQFYLGNFNFMPGVIRLQPMLRFAMAKRFYVAAGPAYSLGFNVTGKGSGGFAKDVVPYAQPLNQTWSQWWGWQFALGIQ